ncbi:MAG TPA: ATP-binding protein [Candidatus Acidoferrales bacterium]|nr:ATP-binding protein [Candidatus Acidoferrales bacterium]
MSKPLFLSLPKRAVVVLALVLVLLIGSLDYLTGRDFALSAFYLIPICWAGWVAGRQAGTLVAAVSTLAWLVANLEYGIKYKYPFTPYWSALMLLMFFLVVTYLLSAFQAAHYHLEETVQRRTAALQEEIAERKHLERAKLQAERLAAVGTMAAQVAHEVRNPLGSITLNLDLIRKEIDKLAAASTYPADEGLTLLKDIRSEVRRIQSVIEDYLKFARLPNLQRRPLALNDFLSEKLAFMNGEFEKAKVKLRTGFDPALTTINADSEQLWQATLNLIRNALDAMPKGGELTVGTWREGGEVRLRITDTGNGMSEEQLRHVFAPFFTTKPQGTGLGLTLVQQIATEHGGHVECESAAGQGSTFTLFLPSGSKDRNDQPSEHSVGG